MESLQGAVALQSLYVPPGQVQHFSVPITLKKRRLLTLNYLSRNIRISYCYYVDDLVLLIPSSYNLECALENCMVTGSVTSEAKVLNKKKLDSSF